MTFRAELFHFSEASFDRFLLEKSSKSAIWGPGVYLSDTPEPGWGKTRKHPGYLYKVQVVTSNDRVVDATQRVSDEAYSKIEKALGRALGPIIKEDGMLPFLSLERRFGSVSDGLSRAGFDVLIHEPPGNKPGRHYVVMNPAVLKIIKTTALSAANQKDAMKMNTLEKRQVAESLRSAARVLAASSWRREQLGLLAEVDAEILSADDDQIRAKIALEGVESHGDVIVHVTPKVTFVYNGNYSDNKDRPFYAPGFYPKHRSLELALDTLDGAFSLGWNLAG